MEDTPAGITTFLLGACAAVSAAITLGYFLYYGLGFSHLQILHAALVAAAVISGVLVAKMMKRTAGD
jgi:phosphate/sulfate permease